MKRPLLSIVLGLLLLSCGTEVLRIEDESILFSSEVGTIRISGDENFLYINFSQRSDALEPPYPLFSQEELAARELILPEKTGNSIFIGEKEFRVNNSRLELVWEDALYQLDLIDNGSNFILELRPSDGEALVKGMGAISHQALVNGKTFSVYQEARYGDQTYLNIPFLYNDDFLSFYAEAHAYDQVRILPNGTIRYTSTDDRMFQGYIWKADSEKEAVSDFYALSESHSLLPRWAYGYIQSRYGYRNQEEVYEIVDQFTEYNLPLSALVLDLYWFDHMGDYWWSEENFGDYEAMDRYLEERGIKLITITEPYFTSDSLLYPELKQRNGLVTNEFGEVINWSSWWTFSSPYGSMMNLYEEGIPEFLGEQYVRMFESGIDGFWTDLGEPEETPITAVFSGLSPMRIHNDYNRRWSRIIYEAMLEAHPDYRIMNLTRSGFTGSAAYNTSVWSGDVSADWNGLEKQLALGLGAGITGFSYWGSDVGGFVSSSSIPPKELFVRWMQFGAYTPVFRAHGSFSAREPWIHDDEADSIIANAIRDRYFFLPHIYSAAYQTWTNGIPIMRPLSMNYGDSFFTYVDGYEFGDGLVVYPILKSNSVEEIKTIRLPEGQWYSYPGFQPFTGGEHLIDASLSTLPVFLKKGAIIPVDLTALDLQRDRAEGLIVLPGSEPTSYLWYMDDGVSNDFKRGIFQTVQIDLDAEKLSLDLNEGKLSVDILIPLNSLSGSVPEGFLRDGRYFRKTVDLQPGLNLIEL
jgi:oligosaccharide 4-alpha-D-glucosyltransferase